ncbi:MAG: HAMP domain-containing histidine kinase [Phycisphaerales bacterium]|nr:HAMP domain-containing histidine kinase [Phycisphaerales bacterium]
MPEHDRDPAENGDSLRPNPTARRSPEAADELTRLAHELSNLLDGSIRWLALADRTLSHSEPDPIDRAREQLETVRGALMRMADLINAALRSRHLSLGSPMLGGADATSVRDVIEHAARVVRPRAEEMGIRVVIDVDPDAGSMPSGPIYSVVLNGLSNALDSIEAAQDKVSGGEIRITARVSDKASDGRRRVAIEISDDGVGLPSQVPPVRLFEPSYTTKPGPRGIGLAVCASIVGELGGTIALTPRPERHGMQRPGAVLRIAFPEPKRGETRVGGSA